MDSASRKSVAAGNVILSAIPDADLALMMPHLEAVELPLRRVLEEINKPARHIYFLDSGIASVVALGSGGRQVEVGIIGKEGVTGISFILGADYPTNQTYMQVAGKGQRIAAAQLIQLMNRSSHLRRLLLRFVHVFLTHLARTAFANGKESLEARLSRWLLMAHDRVETDDIPLTHEFLAIMLGSTRPGVTITLRALERRNLIHLGRGHIGIADRNGLEKAAKDSYGMAESELKRLFVS